MIDERIRLLDELTGGAKWPDRWMGINEFVAELTARGFWDDQIFEGLGQQDRTDFVDKTLRTHVIPDPTWPDGHRPVWMNIGARYKHDRLLNLEDFKALVAWEVEQAKCERAAAEHYQQAMEDKYGYSTGQEEDDAAT